MLYKLISENSNQIVFWSIVTLQLIVIVFLSVSITNENIVVLGNNHVDQREFSGNASNNYLANFRYNPEGPIEGLMKENKTAWITEGGRLPAYILDTNSKGFREDDFSAEKPDQTYRIVFVGDSQTMGWGVNESDRYTDLIEKRLRKEHKSENIEIINTAIPAYGFQDFQTILKQRVSDYQPDLVIIAGAKSSTLSISDQREINREIEERNYSNNSERFQIYNQKVRSRLQEENLSQIFEKWAKKWTETAGDDTSLIYYAYAEESNVDPNYFRGIEREYEISLITGPEDLWNSENIISRDDPHFNSNGHSLHAERLYPIISDYLNG